MKRGVVMAGCFATINRLISDTATGDMTWWLEEGEWLTGQDDGDRYCLGADGLHTPGLHWPQQSFQAALAPLYEAIIASQGGE
jgi:hypothetical protein